MTYVYLVCAIAGILVFLFSRKAPLKRRLLIAAAVTVVAAVVLTALVVLIGDKPSPGAKTYTPNEVAQPSQQPTQESN